MEQKTKKISTSALAKQLSLQPKELFSRLEDAGLIERKDNNWSLTDTGSKQGGQYQTHQKYDQYIVWPESFSIDKPQEETATPAPKSKLLTSSAIGKQFELPAQRVNALFSELGWIKKALKGWNSTPQGEAMGAVQREDYRSGVPYVCWPDSILQTKVFQLSLKDVKGEQPEPAKETDEKEEKKNDFREKFPATFRTTDGHMVRSKAEMLIDNWLYMAEIVHAYERKLPIEEDVYCDFYIPTGKVYIEYWGYENDEKYLKRKEEKLKIYEKYNLHLIQLNDEEVRNLDDILPRMLLKFGVQTY